MASALCGARALGDGRHFVLIALILPTTAASFGHGTKMLMVPCSVVSGTRTRRLSAIALQPILAQVMTPTQTRSRDGSCMIGLVNSSLSLTTRQLWHKLANFLQLIEVHEDKVF